MENYYNLLDSKYKNNSFNPNYGKTHYFEIPFRMCIIGASGSGKTNCVLNLLRVLSRPKPTLTHIYLCVKNKNEPLYQMLEDKLEDNISVFENGEIPLLKDMEPNGEQLIIFDDLVNDKNATKEVIEYFKMARKKNISCVYLSQSYYRIDKFIRSNCSYLIIKKVASKRDLRLILGEYPIDLTIEQLQHLYNNCTKKFEDVMVVDLLNSHIYHNFTKQLL